MGSEPKALIDYPAPYTFKVMGKQEHGFKEYVRQLFHRVLASNRAKAFAAASIEVSLKPLASFRKAK